MACVKLARKHVYRDSLRNGMLRQIATGRRFPIVLLLNFEIQQWLEDRDYSIEMSISNVTLCARAYEEILASKGINKTWPGQELIKVRRTTIFIDFADPNDALMFKLTF